MQVMSNLICRWARVDLELAVDLWAVVAAGGIADNPGAFGQVENAREEPGSGFLWREYQILYFYGW